jgi:hypothetical protein
MKNPFLPMAVGWGVSAWQGPIPTTEKILSPHAASGWLPGLDVPTLSHKARRWSENYNARIAAADWRKEIRPQKIASARGRCERCGCRSEILEVHHLHYKSLWRELPEDLEALCPRCHDLADEERRSNVEWLAAEILELAQFRGYCFRVFGDVPPPPDAWDRFEQWVDAKNERERWQ